MVQIQYIDRQTRQQGTEEVYGGQSIKWLYKGMPSSTKGGRKPRPRIVDIIARLPILSILYGWWQNQPWTKRKVIPFIRKFGIDTSEFLNTPESFRSFNDFFIRKLKREARPIPTGKDLAVIPADGRYRFIPHIEDAEGFIVKGQKFCLKDLLGSSTLAEEYAQGSMVMARLCPTDYHRFHFPCNGVPSESTVINGSLYSVNPLALGKNIDIYTQNKRAITTIESPEFGKVLYIEVGATNVGTIHETYTPNTPYEKGDEKGYFSFGGSALLILFQPNKIRFEQDLLDLSGIGLEVLCRMGQPLGQKV